MALICECDYEQATVSKTTARKARKLHECCECKEEIAPGKTYFRTNMLNDGRWTTFIQCAACNSVAEAMGCFFYEMIYEQLADIASENDGDLPIHFIDDLTPEAREKVDDLVFQLFEDDPEVDPEGGV